MKKKGFTLIELLGVFTILAVILLIAVPSVTGLLKKQKENQYQGFLNDLFLATEAYVETNDQYDLSITNQEIYVKIEEVVKSDFLDSTIINPETNEKVDLNHYVKIFVKGDHTLQYEYKEEAPNVNLTEPVFVVNPTVYTNTNVGVGITYGVEGTKLFRTTVPVTSNINVIKCGRTYDGTCSNDVSKNIEPGFWYKADGNVVLSFEENGSVTAQSVEGINYKSSSSMTVSNIDKTSPTVDLIKSGIDLFNDYNFSNGLNGLEIYNDNSYLSPDYTGVSLNRVSMETPVGSYAIEVKTFEEIKQYPYSGGFLQSVQTYANGMYVHYIIAKIPVGYQINQWTNDIGDNPKITWLTDQKGTGEWKEYIYTVETSGTGKFNNFGYITVSSAEGYSSLVTWYVASSRVIDATISGPTLFMYVKDNNALVEYGCNQSATTRPSYTAIEGKEHGAICDAINSGNYYLWLKDEAGNEKVKLLGTGYSGTMLYDDQIFANGFNSVVVYNNLENELITIERNVNITTPTPVSQYSSLTIKKEVGRVNPDLGGFVQFTWSEPNRTYIHRFIAKIPVGYTVQLAHNAIGTNGSEEWLTDQNGTGKWREYAYIIRAGGTGTFNTFGHVYLSPQSGNSATDAIIWELAYATMLDITSAGQTYMFMVNHS